MSEQEKQPASKYHRLIKPEFKSKIPSHLMSRLDPQEKYMVETLSIMEQQNSWLMDKMVDISNSVVEIDEQQQSINKWKDVLTGRWAIIGWLTTISIPVLLKFCLDWVIKSKNP